MRIGLIVSTLFLLKMMSVNGFSSCGLAMTSLTKNNESNKFEDVQKISRRRILIGTTTFIGSYNYLWKNRIVSAFDDSQYKEGPKGLKYLIVEEGKSDGLKPQRAQKVKTSYALFLNGFEEDGGKKIDSSAGLFGDKPFEFLVGTGSVIKGWDLALMDMKEGESRKLIVPSDLGYGDKGAGGKIPGGATLYFSVTLTELGTVPVLNADQEKWLEEHPL